MGMLSQSGGTLLLASQLGERVPDVPTASRELAQLLAVVLEEASTIVMAPFIAIVLLLGAYLRHGAQETQEHRGGGTEAQLDV